jgi:hypothetical protein
MERIYTPNEIKEKVFPVFKANPIERAILFGSYAKGNPTFASDVDIVIDSNGALLNINFYGVLEELTECLDKRVDLIEISEIRKGTPIHRAVEQEGIILYDKQR